MEVVQSRGPVQSVLEVDEEEMRDEDEDEAESRPFEQARSLKGCCPFVYGVSSLQVRPRHAINDVGYQFSVHG